MSVRITGTDRVIRECQELQDFLASTAPMEGFVEDAKAVILDKTEKGRDFEHKPFAPYSDAYAKKKGSKRVNLSATGTMLRSIFSKVLSAKHGIIDVHPAQEKGAANARHLAQIHHDGEGKQPRRPFMDLNKSQVKALQKKHWDDKILEIVRRYR